MTPRPEAFAALALLVLAGGAAAWAAVEAPRERLEERCDVALPRGDAVAVVEREAGSVEPGGARALAFVVDARVPATVVVRACAAWEIAFAESRDGRAHVVYRVHDAGPSGEARVDARPEAALAGELWLAPNLHVEARGDAPRLPRVAIEIALPPGVAHRIEPVGGAGAWR